MHMHSQQSNEHGANQQNALPQVIQKQAQPGAIKTKAGQKPPIQAKHKPIQAKHKPIQAKHKPLQRNVGNKTTNQGTNNEVQIKANVSALIGTDVSDAQVNYNSSKPAQLQAEATAQGKQVDLAPGKEHHLGHELTHVAQQKQGRVKANVQANNDVGINNDPKLEKEADDIGAKAHSNNIQANQPIQTKTSGSLSSNTNQPTQLFPQKGKIKVPKAKIKEGKDRVKVHKSNIKDVDGRGKRRVGWRATRVSVKSKTKAELKGGTEVKIDYDMMDATGNYIWVQYMQDDDPKIGYVKKDYVEMVEPEPYKLGIKDKDDENKKLDVAYKNVKGKLFSAEPDVTQVKQGYLGDCYFITAVSSLVQRAPDKIKEMMEDKGDYVNVKFYNDQGKRSTVKIKKSVVKYTNGSTKNTGDDSYSRGSLWIKILEKAYATFKNISYKEIEDGEVGKVWKHLANVDSTHDDNKIIGFNHRGRLGQLTNYYQHPEILDEVFGDDKGIWKEYVKYPIDEFNKIKDYGGFVKFFANESKLEKRVADKALAFLAKHYTYIGDGKYTDKEIETFEKIQKATEKGEMVAAGTPSQWYEFGNKLKGDFYEGISAHHYYSVFRAHYDQKSGRRYFKMRNPWGTGGVKYNKENVKGLKKDRYVVDKGTKGLDFDSKKNGEFDMDLAHFLRTMDVIVYSSGMKKLK